MTRHPTIISALFAPLSKVARISGHDLEGCVRVRAVQQMERKGLIALWASCNRYLAHILAHRPRTRSRRPAGSAPASPSRSSSWPRIIWYIWLITCNRWAVGPFEHPVTFKHDHVLGLLAKPWSRIAHARRPERSYPSRIAVNPLAVQIFKDHSVLILGTGCANFDPEPSNRILSDARHTGGRAD